MHYEINVSLNGKHLFATAARSIDSKSQLRRLVKLFRQKFPQQEGYDVTFSYHEQINTILGDDDLIQVGDRVSFEYDRKTESGLVKFITDDIATVTHGKKELALRLADLTFES